MNAPLPSTPRVEPFFFDADPGTRFSLYHAPDPHLPARGAILYVHPFAEEMNKTRRMAALQARAFAALGYAVLQIDLFGCGDSCGDFSSGRWELWKRDLSVACSWLAERTSGPLHLWGVRLGGLLALDFAATSRSAESIILWQPYINGRTAVDQFLRQKLAAEMSTAGDAPGPRSTAGLRAQLAAHGTLEVGGYELAAALVKAIDACDAAALKLPPCSVHWFASGAPAAARVAASAARLADLWAPQGVRLHFHPLDGVPFWASSDIVECPALLAATSAIFTASPR
ncbi:MAG TPA: hydrolase 2, exosortase A system-associated [Telluria sp.]|nr:hydrolase 2, exosortase A system-associated [Telluria sp.]